MIVVVCGGRTFGNDLPEQAFIARSLDRFHAEQLHRERFLEPPTGISLVLEGGAEGADACAWAWAQNRGILSRRFPADWKAHGRSAGPIRNRLMLDWGPRLVIAFPGGSGTANLCKQARARDIEVLEMKP